MKTKQECIDEAWEEFGLTRSLSPMHKKAVFKAMQTYGDECMEMVIDGQVTNYQ